MPGNYCTGTNLQPPTPSEPRRRAGSRSRRSRMPERKTDIVEAQLRSDWVSSSTQFDSFRLTGRLDSSLKQLLTLWQCYEASCDIGVTSDREDKSCRCGRGAKTRRSGRDVSALRGWDRLTQWWTANCKIDKKNVFSNRSFSWDNWLRGLSKSGSRGRSRRNQSCIFSRWSRCWSCGTCWRDDENCSISETGPGSSSRW